jgi:hypothetical protein
VSSDDFLGTHAIHDVPYLEWVRLTDAEKSERVLGYEKGPPVVTKLPAVDHEIQTVAASHTTRAQQILVWAQAVEVTPANLAMISGMLTDFKKEANAVDAELKKLTKPTNDLLKAIRAFFAPSTSAYAQIESILKQKISLAHNAQIVANRNAMAAAQTALQAGDVRGAALAANVIEDTSVPSNITVRETLEYEVVDENAVPRELCSSDPKKIRQWVQAYGETYAPPPGIVIKRGSSVTVRQA